MQPNLVRARDGKTLLLVGTPANMRCNLNGFRMSCRGRVVVARKEVCVFYIRTHVELACRCAPELRGGEEEVRAVAPSHHEQALGSCTYDPIRLIGAKTIGAFVVHSSLYFPGYSRAPDGEGYAGLVRP